MAAVKEASKANDFLGTGRRKTSVARVRVRPGKGTITINERPFEEYFPSDQDRRNVLAPLVKSGKETSVDVSIRVHGGGISGQVTDIHIHAQQLVRVRRRIEQLMAHHTGKALEQIERDMERDFYLDAQEAKAYGLIDEVLYGAVFPPLARLGPDDRVTR